MAALSAVVTAMAGLAVSQVVQAPTALAASSEYNTAVAADSPTGFWPLDEQSGAVVDADGTFSNSTTRTCDVGYSGGAGSGIRCDGSTQRIEIPYASAAQISGSFSTEIWAKLPTDTPGSTGFPSLFSKGQTTSGHYGQLMWFGTGSGSPADYRVRFKRNGLDFLSPIYLKQDRWTHVVFTFNSSTNGYVWYENGVSVASGTNSGLNGTDAETAQISIGANKDTSVSTPNNYAKARIDGLAFYGTTLSSTRVLAHYNARHHESGFTYGGTNVFTSNITQAQRQADFADMISMGATWLRTDVDWQYLEDTDGATYHWTDRYDPFIQDAIDAGFSGSNILAILHTSPNWARSSPYNTSGDAYAPVTNTAKMTTYCTNAVTHLYNTFGITHFQVGNEVNTDKSGYTATAANYKSSLWDPCYSGIAAAETSLGHTMHNQLGSVVNTFGGGGTAPTTFITNVYSTFTTSQFDSVSYHPYTGQVMPLQSTNFMDDSATIHATMASNGDSAKQLWGTEFGETTCTPSGSPSACTGGGLGVTEQKQADMLTSGFDGWYSRTWAGPLFVYTYHNTASNNTQYDNFGIVNFDRTEKIAHDVLASRMGSGLY